MSAAADRALAGLLDEASRTMQRLAGGTAVCTFTRAGTPVPGMKHAEGRWAALRQVQRSAASGAPLAAEAARVRGEWAASLDRARERRSGRDWLAYYAGGVDALDDLADAAAS